MNIDATINSYKSPIIKKQQKSIISENEIFTNSTGIDVQNFSNSKNQLSLSLSNSDNNLSIDELKASKTLYDPIYGDIKLSKKMLEIIDTPEFQRLRNLKQLGACSIVFPGGNHSRFEHCIGTGHLALDLAKKCLISKNYSIIEKENKEIIKCVALAGLCHDIGHGPFSHLFNLVTGSSWDHEEFSGDIIRYLIDKNNIDLKEEEIKFIHSLITGEVNKSFTEESWVYQIVANKTNSIDVDKFDYIKRDIYHLGLSTTSVSYNRIFKDCKIINDVMCFNEKNDLSLLELFESRYNLHKKVYKHNKVLITGSMICDALKLANDYFKFDEAIKDPAKFVLLDDSIIDTICNFSKFDDVNIRDNQNLIKAEQIVKNIFNRKFYKHVGEILIPNGIQFKTNIHDFLCNENPKDEFYISENDIEIQSFALDYGNKDKNPFERIEFYNSRNPTYSFKKLQTSSIIMPKVFRETYALFTCKDESKFERASKMFEIYKKKLFQQWSNCKDTVL